MPFPALLTLVLPFVLAQLSPAQAFFPLEDVRPGLHGVGRTVFSGNRIEEFQVEILGLLRNLGPKQTVILARLSGGPLAQTGVMQGMSGSPVYIDGKLLGAVALAFPFSKEPIAGIQPIQSMLSTTNADSSEPPRPRVASLSRYSFISRMLPAAPVAHTAISSPFGDLDSVLTPVSLSGFTSATLQAFTADFRHLGFEPLQGLSVSDQPGPAPSTSAVVPGSMISVGLLTGDMNMTADGTVTYVDGKRIYAFGHRFLDTGSTEMPFAHSEVIAVVPTLNSSFKLSSPRQWAGAILSDRATAISGEVGRSAHTVPLEVSVHSGSTGNHDYHFQVVNDRFLTPFITQTALFSVLDATERTLGAGTLQLTGRVEWNGGTQPLIIHDTFISDSGLIQQVSADAVVPLAFVLGAGFQGVTPKSMSFQLEASESKRQLRLVQAWTSAHEVHAGQPLEVSALLQGENGLELTRTATYQIPPGTPAGPLNFTVSDANTVNFPEFAGLDGSSLHTPESLVRTINSFRDNDALYVRVWRQQPSFTISGPSASGELSDPPPSVALILADPSNSATANAALTATRGSQIAEFSIPARGYVVAGAKTLQVDIKE